MKKSLLMTIIMSLVLVVAMSTATYAWYTSSSTVNVASTTVTAAISDSSNLAIGAESTATGRSHTLTPAGNIGPMVPIITGLESNVKTAAATSLTKSVAFTAATQTDDSKLVNVVSSPSPASYTEFYVINLNKDTAVTVTPTVTIVDNNTNKTLGLTVAVFAGDTCLGIWSSAAKVYFAKAAITENAATSVVTDNTFTGVKGTGVDGATFDLAKVGAGNNASIKIIAWFDGVELVDAESALNTSFAISFRGAKKA